MSEESFSDAHNEYKNNLFHDISLREKQFELLWTKKIMISLKIEKYLENSRKDKLGDLSAKQNSCAEFKGNKKLCFT